MGRFDALTQIEEPKKTPPLILEDSSLSSPPPPSPWKNKTREPKKSTSPQVHLSTESSFSDSVEKPEKYTTHLEPSLIKKIKVFAAQKDMKDYQLVKKALLLYFEKNK